MPVGRLYVPPPTGKGKIGELRSPFLDLQPKGPVRRNFVLPRKKGEDREKSKKEEEEEGLEASNGGVERKQSRAKVEKDPPEKEVVVEAVKVKKVINGCLEEEEREKEVCVEVLQPEVRENGTADEGEEDEEEYEEEEEEAEVVEEKGGAPEDAPTENGVTSSLLLGEDDNGGFASFSCSDASAATSGEEDDGQVERKQEGEEEEKKEEDEDPSAPPPPPSPPSLSLPDRAKGLKNLGNTCFMNSIIQCLAHAGPILKFCLGFEPRQYQRQGEKDGSSKRGKNRSPSITQAFSNLVKDMWAVSSSSSSLSSDPSCFKREMGSFASRFLGFDQHDSQEFLQFALEGIHGELSKKERKGVAKDSNNNDEREEGTWAAEKRPDPDDPEEPGITPPEAGRRSWRKYLQREGESLVTDLFLGQFRSTLKCSMCNHESVTFEPFWTVSVPIPKPSSGHHSVDVRDCLDNFVQKETLDGDEKPTCERCKKRTKCTKWYTIERWPHILVVHLKRFSPGERFRSKLSCHVNVPVTDLNLSSYSRNKSSLVHYNLYGVSNHSGTLYGGHYTACCRHPYKHSLWHTYNDSMVSGAGHSRVISHEAYLLFFERRDGSTTTSSDGDHAITEDAEISTSGS